MQQISNIIVPTYRENNYTYGINCFNHNSDNGKGGFYIKNKQYYYQSHCIINKNTKNEKTIFSEDLLQKYSPKLYSLLKTLQNSKGISYVYSHFKDGGALPISLILEQNGFEDMLKMVKNLY